MEDKTFFECIFVIWVCTTAGAILLNTPDVFIAAVIGTGIIAFLQAMLN